MTVQTRILTHDEAEFGFGILKAVVEMVKNPKSIEDAYERKRKESSLTEEEVAKFNDARKLIADAASIKQKIDEKYSLLDSMKNAFELDQKSAEDSMNLRNSALLNLQEELKSIANEQNEERVNLENKLQDINDSIASFEAEKNEFESSYNKKLDDYDAMAYAQKAEGERLAKWREELTDKARQIAQLANS